MDWGLVQHRQLKTFNPDASEGISHIKKTSWWFTLTEKINGIQFEKHWDQKCRSIQSVKEKLGQCKGITC